MRDQLIRYVDLLFAGAPGASDIKQEILQNTLDRYDDLVAQGKTPEAAYSLAISGIGDISEILSGGTVPPEAPAPSAAAADHPGRYETPAWKKVLRALGVCLYILCPVPLFVLQDEIGLCGLLAIVAVATALMVIAGGKSGNEAPRKEEPVPASPQSELGKAVGAIVWAVGLCVYFILSFATGAWYITWILFLIIPAVHGLVKACMDLKEAGKYEN